MNFKKILFLFLALLLPVVVFLFLKRFGKNVFDVPPLFQEAVERPVDCESFEYAAPYIISDSVLSKLAWNKNDSLTLVVFNDTSGVESRQISIQIDRLRAEFPKEKLNLIVNREETFRSCVFLLKSTENAAIVDSKKRIRGQYKLTDLEDADRLIMEIKIILKKY